MSADWAGLGILVAYVLVGAGLGAMYFGSLWWSAGAYARGGRWWPALVLAMGRFAALGVVLARVSLEGAMPLLATALGVLVARSVVLRRLRNLPA